MMETEGIRLLPEVTKLPRVELRAYVLKRARRIVRETPGDSDAWCDPEGCRPMEHAGWDPTEDHQ